jgi:hypothetical protein
MILIPSAFLEVFFEPITIPLITAYRKVLWYLKWVGIFLLYLLALCLTALIVIAVFVVFSDICKYFGVKV